MSHMWTLPCNFIFQTKSRNHLGHVNECAQIGRFIALWATFQSRWQQFFCSDRPHFLAIFLSKVSKSFVFLVKSFWATFIDIWRFFTGHAGLRRVQMINREDERQSFEIIIYKTFGPESMKKYVAKGWCVSLGQRLRYGHSGADAINKF